MKRKIIRRIIIIIIVFILFSFLAFTLYTSNPYKAVDCDNYLSTTDKVEVLKDDDDNIWFNPKENVQEEAIVFYPGGLVEAEAYAPIMFKLANLGYQTVICKMPYNLALLNYSKASDAIGDKQDKKWYIAGHSLGGAFAARYYKKHNVALEGLILLAAYSDQSLTDLDNAKVLQIYGSNDNVINHDKLEKYASNLPTNTTKYIIEGGIHSYFGSYGIQKGDGNPTIDAITQYNLTVDYISNFVEA